MKITVEKLKELNACNSGIEYFGSKHSDGVELTDLIREDIGTNNWTILEYADWLMVHCMTCEQRTDYIIYVTELGLPKYKEKYPDNPRIHNCIQAIKDFRDGKIMKKELLDITYAAVYVVNAAYTVADVVADKNAMMIKILQYGITLLEVKKNGSIRDETLM